MRFLSGLAMSVLLMSLLIRSLIAPGYMPQPLSGSGPLSLCHSGLSTAVSQQLFGNAQGHRHHAASEPGAGHHHHHGHHHPADQASGTGAPEPLTSADLCPLDNGLSSALIVEAAVTLPLLDPSGPSLVRSSRWVRTPGLSAFLARGPPLILVLS
jgi:hypothetical protein